MDSVSYKAILVSNDEHKEIRRFTVNGDVSTSLIYLQHKLQMIFPELKGEEFKIVWKDEDNDEVTLGTDEELSIALVSLQDSLKKIFIYPKPSSIKVHIITDENEPEEGEFEEIHYGVECDGCGSSVIGFRYKCLQCMNYDLCEKCESKHVHSNHALLRIPEPIPHRDYSWFWSKMNLLVNAFNKSVRKTRRLNLEEDPSGHSKHSLKKCRGRHRHHRGCDRSDSDEDGTGEKRAKMGKVYMSSCAKSFADALGRYGVFVDPVGPRSENESQNERSTGHGSRVADNVEYAIANIFKPFVEAVHKGMTPKTKSETENGASASKNQENGKSNGVKVDDLAEKLAKQNVFGPDVQSRPSAPMAESSPSAPMEEPSTAKESESTRNENIYPTLPMDPKVAKALKDMLSMGFTNEGDNLRKIIEEMDGDVMKVLECIDSALK